MDLIHELKALTKAELNRLLKTLSYREREIVKLRLGVELGLGDGYTYTREEVAHIFKLTVDKLKKLEKDVFSKLARQLPIRVGDVSPLEFLLEPGGASKEEIAEL